MAKNDPTGKAHYNVTKTSSQQARKGSYSANESTATGGSSIELMTPKNLLGGLSGINRASNKSDEKNFGSGSSQGLKLGAGLNSSKLQKPSNSSSSKSVGA